MGIQILVHVALLRNPRRTPLKELHSHASQFDFFGALVFSNFFGFGENANYEILIEIEQSITLASRK